VHQKKNGTEARSEAAPLKNCDDDAEKLHISAAGTLHFGAKILVRHMGTEVLCYASFSLFSSRRTKLI
jgi:hypothetical protein